MSHKCAHTVCSLSPASYTGHNTSLHLGVSGAGSFGWLSSIPLYGCITELPPLSWGWRSSPLSLPATLRRVPFSNFYKGTASPYCCHPHRELTPSQESCTPPSAELEFHPPFLVTHTRSEPPMKLHLPAAALGLQSLSCSWAPEQPCSRTRSARGGPGLGAAVSCAPCSSLCDSPGSLGSLVSTHAAF